MLNEEKESKLKELETEKIIEPTLVHDGKCDHDFEEYIEGDLLIRKCKKCPLGLQLPKE
jgi:hypothetical protein